MAWPCRYCGHDPDEGSCNRTSPETKEIIDGQDQEIEDLKAVVRRHLASLADDGYPDAEAAEKDDLPETAALIRDSLVLLGEA